MAGIGVSTAIRATRDSAGCSTTANKPVKSGNVIYSSASASCPTTASRTLFIELHRSQGWWHPIVGTNSNSDVKKTYSTSTSSCDDNAAHVYFSEVSMSGGVEINSGNTTSLSPTC